MIFSVGFSIGLTADLPIALVINGYTYLKTIGELTPYDIQ